MKVTVDRAIEIGPFVPNKFGENYLYSVNRKTFDQISSSEVFSQYYGSSFAKNNHLFIIIGTDSGLLPKYVEKIGVRDGSRFFFIELPEVLHKIETLIEKTASFQIAFASFDDWKQKLSELKLQDYMVLKNVRFVKSLGAMDCNLIEYAYMGSSVQETLEQTSWDIWSKFGNKEFYVRQIENLSENRHSAACLRNIFKGRTAAILAGGPSLDENLPWLLENRDNLILIAVSRIARRLLQVGLTPHIVISIDPHPVSFDVSKEMLKFGEEVLFVNHFHVASTLLGQWGGRHLYLRERYPWGSPLNQERLDASGPTVTNAALDLALGMGVSRVLLAGVDLCYSRTGQTHASGSNESSIGPQLGRGQMVVETYGGWLAETTPDFSSAAKTLQIRVEMARPLGCTIYNVSPGACRIPGIEYRSITDVPLGSGGESATAILARSLPEDSSEVRRKYYLRNLEELDRVENSLKKMRLLVVKGLKANEALFGRKGKRRDFKYKLRMDKIEEQLNTEFSDFSPLVKKFGIYGFLELTRPDQEKAWTDQEIEDAGRIYYETYRNSIDELLKILQSSRERLVSRLEEEKEKPNLGLLLKQWVKDGQQGRTLLFKKRRPDVMAQLSDEERSRLEEMELEFHRILEHKETVHLNSIRKFCDLRPVRGKALRFFRQKEQRLLSQLVDSLQDMEGDSARQVHFLARGYLAELEGDTIKALESYQSLFEFPPGMVLEDALARIAAISIEANDFQNAELALKCLNDLSPVYSPTYAELLKAVGRHRDALDLYADYLEKVPADFSTMLKLGNYYMELGHWEGAEVVFHLVLEKDPSNTTAHALLHEVKNRNSARGRTEKAGINRQ